MAVVAIAAVRCIGLVAVGQTPATLRQLFPLFPVTQKLAVGRPFDSLQVDGLDGLGSVFAQRFSSHIGSTAGPVGFIRIQNGHFNNAFVTEGCLDDVRGQFI